MNEYKPISCDFHSYLEHFAVQRETVLLKCFPSSPEDIEGVIEDLYTKKNEEFIVVNSLHIRLDEIISVNGVELSDFQQCNVS